MGFRSWWYSATDEYFVHVPIVSNGFAETPKIFLSGLLRAIFVDEPERKDRPLEFGHIEQDYIQYDDEAGDEMAIWTKDGSLSITIRSYNPDMLLYNMLPCDAVQFLEDRLEGPYGAQYIADNNLLDGGRSDVMKGGA